ncbi:hypothetical protein LX36DRAFT_684308 [Colletotrichum falcatum]|nr:hypothetical protein LX36DRAFT_684308 [Colletotrichum falcatum]
MMVIKPLYGITEAGTHWWATYSNHHREKLQMDTSTFDPYLLISSLNTKNFSLIGMQTNDTIRLTDKRFSDQEDNKLKRVTFTAKPKQVLAVNNPITSLTSQQQYVKQRVRGVYIVLILKMKNPNRGLRFQPIKLATAKLFVFLGFIIILGNEQLHEENDESNGNAFTLRGNIIYYSSTKCKRVTRSVLASEIYGMVAGADVAYAISTTLAIITDRLQLTRILTIIYTDLYSLYECLVKLSDDNIADSFTKLSLNHALE